MSHIPVQVVPAENHGSNLPGFATAAKRVAPGDIRIWTLALAALLLATAGAQAQAVFGTIAVGGSNPPAEQSVSVTALVGGTVNSVKILTAGASNQDFTAGSGPSCVSATPSPIARSVLKTARCY
jgi:hypothetical protein